MIELAAKETRLRRDVRACGSLLVAYSGGVDSALVLKIAHDELGHRALGVTADSPSVPRSELAAAARIAQAIGAAHRVVRTHELEDPSYAANPTNRCYFCKSELYGVLMALARDEGFARAANGTNADDMTDFRPGLRAADEHRVVSPLRDAGLGKGDVRALARALGLEVWDKPASPCLSSRIPHGSVVTPEKLATIEAAEAFIRGLGFRQLRVRHFGERARIETPRADLDRLRGLAATLRTHFSTLGFTEVELAEFKSGALNPVSPDLLEDRSDR